MICAISMYGFNFIREYFPYLFDAFLKKTGIRGTCFSHIDMTDRVQGLIFITTFGDIDAVTFHLLVIFVPVVTVCIVG